MIRTEHKDGFIFPFVEYKPDGVKGKLPLIIQLHGAGERGNGEDLSLMDEHGFSEMLKNGEYECLFIMPQCPQDSFWVARVESIIKFIDEIKSNYNIDESRVYLTGLSMGGYGTWYTSMARPDLFSAIAPVCGGGMAWNVETLTMPIWVFHGEKDDVVSPFQSDEMVNALKEKGMNVRYTKVKDVGHNVWDYAYNKELYEWLLSNKK